MSRRRECKLVQPLWNTGWRVLRKLTIEPPYDLGIPLLGIYAKETKARFQKAIWTPYSPRCSLQSPGHVSMTDERIETGAYP